MTEQLDFFNDIPQTTPADNATIAELAKEQLEAEAAVERAELTLKDAKAKLRDVQENRLPAAMLVAGCRSFELENGFRIQVSEKLHGEIGPKISNVVAFLKANNKESLIKSEVALKFSPSEYDKMRIVVDELSKNHYDPEVKESVNTASFKKLIKEMTEDGLVIGDYGELGLYKRTMSEIKK